MFIRVSGLQASLLPGLRYTRQKENPENSVMLFFKFLQLLLIHFLSTFQCLDFFQYSTVRKLDVFSKRNGKNVSSHFFCMELSSLTGLKLK